MKILLYEIPALSYAWLLIPAILILPVVLASMFLCAPKWLEKHPVPQWAVRPAKAFDTWGAGVADVLGESRLVKLIARIGNFVLAVIFGVTFLPFALGLLYIQACVAVIEGACPYTHDSEWRGWMSNQWKFLTAPFEPSKWDQRGGPLT